MKVGKMTVLLVLISFTTACASGSQDTDPDDMSVEEHQAAAQEHEEKAEQHAEQYDSDAESQRQSPGVSTSTDTPEIEYDLEAYNPTEKHKEYAERHAKHANQHEEAAQALLNYEEKHCQKFPEETRATCPLMGQVASAVDVDSGVEMSFDEGVNFEAMVDHIRCHYAFARTEGHEGMATCPLYVKKIEIDSDSEARTVTIKAEGDEAVEKVRERARAHVVQP
ncbi:MAG: hypothetical protein ACQEVA_04305 [Myxococcota bacterium]